MRQQDRAEDRRNSPPKGGGVAGKEGVAERPAAAPAASRTLSLPPDCHFRVFIGRDEPELLERLTRLRAEIWKDFLPAEESARNFPDGHWREEIDDASYQWAVLNAAGELVATTRLTLAPRFEDLPNARWWAGPTGETLIPVPGPVAWLARKVVVAAYQSSGMSTLLRADQMRWARRLGARSVLVQARGSYTDRLVRQGYQRLCPARPGILFPSCEFSCLLLALEDASAPAETEP